ncbi:MAG: RNA pseudouridine synthase [Gammaproteobacteria bacterium]|nr:MAG: RNA pseudouridine synthase [Gammaproteobacteria bacterium]
MKLEKHIDIETSDETAVDILGESAELSKQAIKRAMTKGAVWLTRNQHTQRVRRADKSLRSGDQLHLYFDEEVLGQQPKNAVLIADEGLYSVWIKPYGMLSQGSKWGDHCTINRWVEKNLLPQRAAFIVHRLDRAAAGLMIVAHQKKVAAYFSRLFEQRQVEKNYQAIVYGQFKEDKKFDSDIDNKSALSRAKLLKYDAGNDQSLLEVSIETGRKHQIRRHLSEAGFPIVGDRLYGDVNDALDRNLCLISCYLSFVSPIDDTKKIYILPESMSPEVFISQINAFGC